MKKLFCRRLAMIAASALIFQSSLAVAGVKTYTTTHDFRSGGSILRGLLDTNDQLQIKKPEGSTLPFIWIANSGENTVSLKRTDTGCELGRYLTGPSTVTGVNISSQNPSRTTVDLYGGVWVGNRGPTSGVSAAAPGTATHVKLLWGIDGNGNLIPPPASVKTSRDTNGDCHITPDEVLAWGEDEAVDLRVDTDDGPRALAVDKANNVWIGGAGLLSDGVIHDCDLRYLNGETGELIKSIDLLGHMCYGAVIGSDGTLYIATGGSSFDGQNAVIIIEDPTGNHRITVVPTPGGRFTVYGITIDHEGYVWVTTGAGRHIGKLDPRTKTWVFFKEVLPPATYADGGYMRGIAVGFDGDIWVANTNRNEVWRFDKNGNLKAIIPVGAGPTGVAVDAAGKIWVSNRVANNVQRIDPATNKVDFTQKGHFYAYNYSDMAGFVLNSVTARHGDWTVVYQDQPFNQATVSWNADTPGDSTVTVMVRSSTDGVTWSAWQQVQSGVPFNTVTGATRLQFRAELSASSDLQSPVLHDLTVTTVNTPAPSPGTLQISTPHRVNEDAGTVSVTVSRVGGNDGAVSVTYATSDGTATANNDYTPKTGTFAWADGDSDDKTITVPVTSDDNPEDDEVFTVGLSNPTGGAELGNSKSDVTIVDDDPDPAPQPVGTPGTLQISTPHRVNEKDGSATIPVDRVGGSDGAVSVTCATSDGTATAGEDYTAVTETLSWDDDEGGSKGCTVPVNDDSKSEGPETLELRLTNPTGGATLGQDTSTVTIVDDDTTLVTLHYFAAAVSGNGIELEWQTGDESNNAGFRIWRATGEGFESIDFSSLTSLDELTDLINERVSDLTVVAIPSADQLIPADGENGDSYTYIDDDVDHGTTYYYLLEDVDNLGVSTYHVNAIDWATTP